MNHSDDGFLGDLHAMLLMDDAMILSTSRKGCLAKLKTVQNFCDEYGMVLNQKKTQFMVVNGSGQDKTPLPHNEGIIQYTDHYVYLGAHFVDNGKMTSVIKYQAESCRKHVHKFSAFLQKNTNMPFTLKLKVFHAALMSSMLYGCESWLCDNLKSVNQHYMNTIKLLLGVRVSTPNEICLLEIGLPDLRSIILKKRCSFMKAFIENSAGNEPLALALTLRICQNSDRRSHNVQQTDGGTGLYGRPRGRLNGKLESVNS